ncbi:MAG: hypothetical protein Q9O62_12865 [Ardenticatenia bacterium]|nr:hypothetical protein [Ardenticatenia bacterium]
MRTTKFLFVLAAGVFTLAYVYIYQEEPISPLWSEAALSLLYTLAAGLAALFMAMVYHQFEPDEPAGQMWRFFMWGLWTWALAEAVWGLYPVIWEEAPLVSVADIFWAGGYVWFAVALMHQYQLVYGADGRWRWRHVALVAGGVVATSALLTFLLVGVAGLKAEDGWLPVFLNIFYPLGDGALALAAWRIARLFRGGRWARPWLALLAFVVADAAYTSLFITGIYSFEGNLPSLLADVLYLDAYLFLAFMIYDHLTLLRQGISLSTVSGE